MVYRVAEAMLTFGPMRLSKLHSLCFYSYAWYLTFFGQKLFSERFMAGERGPVCPEIQIRYALYDGGVIPPLSKDLSEIVTDPEKAEFIRAVYDAHGCLKDHELIQLACSEDPWCLARYRYRQGEGSGYYLDDEIIQWNTKKILKELNRENELLV